MNNQISINLQKIHEQSNNMNLRKVHEHSKKHESTKTS